MGKLRQVASSMIRAFGYDAEARTLEVVFKNGRKYWYKNVPRSVYKELLAADSKGRFLQSEIIDVYPTFRVMDSPKR